MIASGEIRELAIAQGVRQETIEKDYVLGWILAGLYNIESTGNWIFKGGTALKKCYFHNYRFSEDLDFSLKDHVFLEEDALHLTLSRMAEWVYDNSGIEISKKRSIVEIFENRNKRQVAQIRVYYHGPVSPSAASQWARIKFDLTTGEVLTDEPILANIYHPYSDTNNALFKTRCYSFTEIFAEKLRALVERTRPRDVYDSVKCYDSKISDFDKVKEHFLLKMAGKSLQMPDTITLLTQIKNSREFWTEQLAHQISSLENFEEFEGKIMIILDKLIAS